MAERTPIKYSKEPPKIPKKPQLKHQTLPQPKPRKNIPSTRTLLDRSITEATSLKDLVVNHSNKIPFSVNVVAENVEYEPSINLGDSLIIHGIKQSHVITIADQANEAMDIPFYSAAKFGIIGNLDSEEYMSTFSVTELMDSPKLPPIVACLGNFQGKENNMSFTQFEILLLKDVSTKGFFKHKKPVIRAYSMTNFRPKFIPKECDALFSVDPSGVQLYPSEILEYASHLLPCRARPFVPKEYRDLLKDFTAKVVVIEGQSIETSLLACKVDRSGTNKEYLEISTNVDLVVTIEKRSVITTEEDIHHTKYTRLSSHREHLSECMLKMIRKGKETEAVKISHLKISEADSNTDNFEDSSDPEAYDDVIVSPVEDVEEIYDDLVWDTSLPPKSRSKSLTNLLQRRKFSAPPTVPPKSPSMQKYQNVGRKSLTTALSVDSKTSPPVAPRRRESVGVRHSRLSVGAESNEDIESRFSGGSSTTDETPTLVSIQKTLSILVEKVDKLQQNHSLMEQRLQKLEASKGNFDRPRNGKKIVSSMNQVDIQDMLEKLGMSQYRHAFLKKWVDGEKFLGLTEKDLKEMGVSSEEDRSKILNIISNGRF